MYNHKFGFNESPFSIAPDPHYLYMSELHQEALAHLCYGVQSEGCIILLTGDVGTGKTTICRLFLEQLAPENDVAVIINPKLTERELLATICDEFQITPASRYPTAKNYIDSLNSFLLAAHAAGRQAMLIVDEAQNLAPRVLEMLRLLTNLETDKRKLLKIFLLGQPELTTILARPGMLQISQRVTSRYHLTGLLREDVELYIRHRIAIAGGGTSHLFSNSAVTTIFEHSRGIPRVINSLCDRALLGAYVEGADQVDRRVVKKAARELFGHSESGLFKNKPLRLAHTIAAIVLVTLLSLWLGMKSGHVPVPDAAIRAQSKISSLFHPEGGELHFQAPQLNKLELTTQPRLRID